jgi:hypothetical protein
MKIKGIRGFVARGLAVGVVGVLSLTGFNAKGAAHELIFGVNLITSDLVSFFSDAPGTIQSSFQVTGMQPNEVLRGIDFQNGTVYGLGSLNRLYSINLGTHVATQVGSPFTVFLNGSSFGVDTSATTMRAMSNLRQNLSIDLATGVATAAPDLSYAPGDQFAGQLPNVSGLAFVPGTSNWIAADSLKNSFATVVPATGVLTTIGLSGIDFSRNNGFDISAGSGIAYLGSPAASSDPAANLYTVNLANGSVTLVGLIGAPGDNYLISGLTVVPEPSAIAMLAFGGLLLVVFRRRR